MCMFLPGEPVVFTNWVPGRKSWNHGVEDCVILVNGLHGQWEDFECDHHRHYICEFGKFIVWFFVNEGALISMVTISSASASVSASVYADWLKGFVHCNVFYTW